MDIRKLKIALVLGGVSTERAVSQLSGQSMYKALISLGCNPILIDPALGIHQHKDLNAFFEDKKIYEISAENYLKAVNSKLFDKVDIALLALHGKWGEDGTIQALLEFRGIKYTGSKILASALTMDKIMSKIFFQHFNVLTPKWFAVENYEENYSAVIEKVKNELGFPCVVKPNDQGSTYGLTICRTDDELPEAVNTAKRFSSKVFIESYIEGRELTVAVLDKEALPVLEIKPKHDVYDYDCKYTSGMSEYFVPADIPEEVAKHLKKQALDAHFGLGCEVYSRSDFRLSHDMKSYCLEVNTLPGMTSTSLVPKMAKSAGITFEELIERIIVLSLKSW